MTRTRLPFNFLPAADLREWTVATVPSLMVDDMIENIVESIVIGHRGFYYLCVCRKHKILSLAGKC